MQTEIESEKIFLRDLLCNNFLQRVLRNSYYNRYITAKFI